MDRGQQRGAAMKAKAMSSQSSEHTLPLRPVIESEPSDLMFAGTILPPVEMTCFKDGRAMQLTPSAAAALLHWLGLEPEDLAERDDLTVFRRRGSEAIECSLIDSDRNYSVTLIVHSRPPQPICVAGTIRVCNSPSDLPCRERCCAHGLFSAHMAVPPDRRDSRLQSSSERAQGLPEYIYEIAALRAVGSGRGSLFVIDVERAEVVWTDSDREDNDWLKFEHELVIATKSLLRAESDGEPPRSPRPMPGALLVSARTIRHPQLTGVYAACRVQLIGRSSHPFGILSPRERSIAQLLVGGYAAVNAAAIIGITEHTVRTYIRRVYRKLGVRNRADLARAMSDLEGGLPDENRVRAKSGILPVARRVRD
jgi:DNA-binding CsgD family transcriptional regulator